MIDSLRDQLLNLGFKAPEPTPRPRPQSRSPAGAGKEGRGGAGGAGQPRGGAAARELARAFWSAPTRQSFAAYWSGCRHLYNTRPAADPEAGARTLINLDILLHFAAGEMQGQTLLPGLAKARCPVLVMVGEADPVCPLEDALEMAAALPPQWMQLARFADVGHGAWRDDPEAAFAVLRRFILE